MTQVEDIDAEAAPQEMIDLRDEVRDAVACLLLGAGLVRVLVVLIRPDRAIFDRGEWSDEHHPPLLAAGQFLRSIAEGTFNPPVAVQTPYALEVGRDHDTGDALVINQFQVIDLEMIPESPFYFLLELHTLTPLSTMIAAASNKSAEFFLIASPRIPRRRPFRFR